MTLLAWEMSAIIWWLEHSLALAFFGIEMKTGLFQSWATAGSSRFTDILNATLDSIILRILNSSTGIISHPLALLTAVLLKAHWATWMKAKEETARIRSDALQVLSVDNKDEGRRKWKNKYLPVYRDEGGEICKCAQYDEHMMQDNRYTSNSSLNRKV